MKKPLILVTTSNNVVEDTFVVRLNHEYVNAVVQAGGIPVIKRYCASINHQYSLRRALPENTAYFFIRHVFVASHRDGFRLTMNSGW